jgi:hypothetical protein
MMNKITQPLKFVVNNINVYEAINIYNYDSSFFPGCIRTRLIVDKKKLVEEDYLYAYIKKGEWIKSKKSYCKAKLLLNAEWVEKNVPKFIKMKKVKEVEVEENEDEDEDEVEEEVEEVEDELLYEVMPAPDILELEENEQFKDKDGNLMDIEVRGERERKQCYFSVKDVSKLFKITDLRRILIVKSSNYCEKTHYKYFTIQKVKTIVKTSTKNSRINPNKKEIFLTYKGLLKVLFSSRTGNAEYFQDWAEDILFTVQLGDKNQKNELVSKVLGGYWSSR